MTSSSEQILASLARCYCSGHSKKTLKGRSQSYIEPVYSKSNLRWVVGGEEVGGEKVYLRVRKGKMSGREGLGVWG